MVASRYLILLLVIASFVLVFSSILSPLRYLGFRENEDYIQQGENQKEEVKVRLKQEEALNVGIMPPPYIKEQAAQTTAVEAADRNKSKPSKVSFLTQTPEQYDEDRWRKFQDDVRFPLPRLPGQRQPTTEDCCTYNGDLEPIPGSRGPGLSVIGVQKGGTTFLNSVLTQKCNFYSIKCPLPTGRKQLIGAPVKEVHFFDILGTNQEHLEAYLRGFEPDEGRQDWTGLDSTPSTVRMSFAPCRIRRALPDMKAVLLLREPADAMRSSYLMNYGKGSYDQRQPPPLKDILSWNLERLEKQGCLFGVKTPQEVEKTGVLGNGVGKPRKDEEVKEVLDVDKDYEEDEGSDDVEIKRLRHLVVDGGGGFGDRYGARQVDGGATRELQAGEDEEKQEGGLKTWGDCSGCEYSGRLDRGQTGCFPPNTDLTDADVKHGQKYAAQYLPRVMYAPQVAWWLDYFTPENLMIVNSQRLKEDTVTVIREIQEFVGHSPNFSKESLYDDKGQLINFNPFQHRNWREVSSEELIKGVEEGYKLALEAFKPLNQQLYKVLEYYGYNNFDKFKDDDGREV